LQKPAFENFSHLLDLRVKISENIISLAYSSVLGMPLHYLPDTVRFIAADKILISLLG
jgi:hypothetical protein